MLDPGRKPVRAYNDPPMTDSLLIDPSTDLNGRKTSCTTTVSSFSFHLTQLQPFLFLLLSLLQELLLFFLYSSLFLSLSLSLSLSRLLSFYYVLYLSSLAQTLQNEAHHSSEFIRSLPFARNKSPTFRKRRTALNLPLRVPRFVALFVHFQHIPDPGVCRGSCHEIEWLNRSIFFIVILWVGPMINWNERIIINIVYFWKLRSKYRFRRFV